MHGRLMSAAMQEQMHAALLNNGGAQGQTLEQWKQGLGVSKGELAMRPPVGFWT